jgi:hypothetical protein
MFVFVYILNLVVSTRSSNYVGSFAMNYIRQIIRQIFYRESAEEMKARINKSLRNDNMRGIKENWMYQGDRL